MQVALLVDCDVDVEHAGSENVEDDADDDDGDDGDNEDDRDDEDGRWREQVIIQI